MRISLLRCFRCLGWLVLCCGCGAPPEGATNAVSTTVPVPAGPQSADSGHAAPAPPGRTPLPVAPVKPY
jgi:hypothetical protein